MSKSSKKSFEIFFRYFAFLLVVKKAFKSFWLASFKKVKLKKGCDWLNIPRMNLMQNIINNP